MHNRRVQEERTGEEVFQARFIAMAGLVLARVADPVTG